MATEAQRATRSREQTNSTPRIPASKSSLAHTFSMCRREADENDVKHLVDLIVKVAQQ
ncbi:hypothetical protein ACLBWH_12235 [Sphingomonas sp. M6A6_1c]